LEELVQALSLLRRLVESAERLDSRFDELILAVRLLVGRH